MADLSQSFVHHRHWKQWLRRIPTRYYSKILLLIWVVLLHFSWDIIQDYPNNIESVVSASVFFSFSFAPLVGWLADVKFGRYKVIKFGSLALFLASILHYFAMVTIGGASTLSNVFLSLAIVIAGFGYTCYLASILPFLTDQIVGATSDELSAVVRWYYWTEYIATCLSNIIAYYGKKSIFINNDNISSTTFLAIIPLAVIIISDCLCQQWLDRTHKVTNPIKLIIQVLDYTRKHRYPERRSAFTYIDEEQPSRIDHGKEKFGGPFTEEEVEDVKTVLRLLPLVICFSLSVNSLENFHTIPPFIHNNGKFWVNQAILHWLFPLILIPLYQFFLYRCFQHVSLNMLQIICAGLFSCKLAYIVLSALLVVDVIVSENVSCTAIVDNPGNHLEWYWKFPLFIVYGIGKTIIGVLLFEFVIAQSPDKMKGFVFGITITTRGLVFFIYFKFIRHQLTLCCLLFISLFLVVLFVVFLVLSKRYTLRERNIEINIQAIVEEHCERYMDQEEEYNRENPQSYYDSDSDYDIDVSNTE